MASVLVYEVCETSPHGLPTPPPPRGRGGEEGGQSVKTQTLPELVIYHPRALRRASRLDGSQANCILATSNMYVYGTWTAAHSPSAPCAARTPCERRGVDLCCPELSAEPLVSYELPTGTTQELPISPSSLSEVPNLEL